MGYRLVVKGQNDEIVLEKESILNVKYFSNTPKESSSRATDLSVILEVVGKITSISNGEKEDDTRKLAIWSLMSSESYDIYRNTVLEIVEAGNVIRKIIMPNSFIIDYNEEFSDKLGTGIFSIKIKQKQEKVKDISIEGGYQNV